MKNTLYSGTRVYALGFVQGTSQQLSVTPFFDNSLVITAVFFEETQFQFAKTELSAMSESLRAGERLAEKLEKEGSVHVFVLSEGLNVN